MTRGDACRSTSYASRETSSACAPLPHPRSPTHSAPDDGQGRPPASPPPRTRGPGRARVVATLGFVGLGAMGSGMARRLLAAGHELHGYNRTQEKATSLVPHGLIV